MHRPQIAKEEIKNVKYYYITISSLYTVIQYASVIIN